MKTTDVIYELIDHSDDERCYSLGVFLDKEEALSFLDGADPSYNEHDAEVVILRVRSRLIGFHPHEYSEIASKSWERNYGEEIYGEEIYGEEIYEEKWISHPIELNKTECSVNTEISK